LPELKATLDDEDALARLGATYALARVTGNVERYLPQLLLAWRDTYDPEEPYPVLPHLFSCLSGLGPQASAAVPKVLTWLEEPRDQYSQDREERATALRWLGQMGSAAKAAVPRLRRLASGDDALAPLAAEALEKIEGR
jgi:hypothetical protein